MLNDGYELSRLSRKRRVFQVEETAVSILQKQEKSWQFQKTANKFILL